jgi:hypothetical protein
VSRYNPRAKLTSEQNAKLDEFIALLAKDSLTSQQRQFCDEACLLRYLRARDYKLKKSHTLLKGTLQWREQYKPDQIRASDLKFEASSGKTVRHGFDKDGCPVIYITPARENSTDYAKNMKLLIHTFERAIESMPVGVEQMTWVLDFNGYTTKNAPPLSVCKDTISILSNHYPERLKAAIIVDPPKAFKLFYKIIRPVIPPVTKEKVFFAKGDEEKKQLMPKFFDMSQIEPRFGGTSSFNWVTEFENIWTKEIEAEEKRTREPVVHS